MRGNHGGAPDAGAPDGSIPACAGEPTADSDQLSGLTVYPRVCGGTSSRPPSRVPWNGLSPRVRGNRREPPPHTAWVRSIPACAGEPTPGRRRRLESWVYPRVCGGTRSATETSAASSGLSPRVRGNPLHPLGRRPLVGSIPACAGEPVHPRDDGLRRQVYPRVCGGTKMSRGGHMPGMGLSPRVRGNLQH